MPEAPAAPPRWILILLWPFKGEFCYQQIEGDLLEEFNQRKEIGMDAARLWYHREVLRNFWAMIWRWVMIPVVIVPFFCVLLGDVFSHAFIKASISHLPLRLIFGVDRLFISAFAGLILGMICSRMMKGHERLVRLSFGAFQLIYLTIIVVTAQALGPSKFILLWLSYLRPICAIIFFGLGSNWIERRTHRRFEAT